MAMRRRDFIAGVAGSAAAWPLTARAQQTARPVVGWLTFQSLNSAQPFIAAFRKGLNRAGFVEGENVTIQWRSGNHRPERLPELAAELIRRRVNVLFVGTVPAALAAMRATSTIPIVFTSGADPVKIGLVSSFSRPGGNVTGFYIQFSELVGKRVSLLHEMVPTAMRMAVLVNPANREDNQPTVRNATDEARTLGLDIRTFSASTINEIDAAFAALVLWHADTVLVGNDPFFDSRQAQIAALAVRHRLPASGFLTTFVQAGGLMSYAPDLPDMYARAGDYVGRILKGEKPADLPVQQPTKYELAINLKTAKAIGLDVPPTLLALANAVIE
jgi:putative ABC transport system substrate-binding protein